MRKSFPIPRFNARKFQKLAEEHEIDLVEVNVQRLVEDFHLRHRHLLKGDLSDEQKKRIVKKIPSPSETSDEYQNALFFLSVFMCKGDWDKAWAILYCFARLGEANIHRQVNKICNSISGF